MAEQGNNVNQENNEVLGDQAGRDIIKPVYNIGASSFGGIAQLERLYKRLQDERKNDITINDIIEELKHFKSQANSAEILELEVKLNNGNRVDLLDFALAVKEKFTMKLLRNEHSESAQEIFAVLLGKVWTSFQINVYPKIKEGHPNEFINSLIQEHIVKPLEEILGENLLKLYDQEIHGMIYFLTGNCHLKWN
jgi:hypothetical protein